MISGLSEPFFIRTIRNTFNAIITCAFALCIGTRIRTETARIWRPAGYRYHIPKRKAPHFVRQTARLSRSASPLLNAKSPTEKTRGNLHDHRLCVSPSRLDGGRFVSHPAGDSSSSAPSGEPIVLSRLRFPPPTWMTTALYVANAPRSALQSPSMWAPLTIMRRSCWCFPRAT